MRSFILALCFPFFTSAQPYVEGGNTRHRFAQLELGVDIRCFSSWGTRTSYRTSNNILQTSLNPHTESRLIIGGTHFWGHADFFVAFPVASLGKSRFGTLVETGARYFPWRIENKKLRPFAGFSWQPTSFKQNGGSFQIQHQFPLTAGLVYNKGAHIWELSAGYFYNYKQTYYIDRITKVNTHTPQIYFSVAYKFLMETTLSAEKNWKSGRTAQITNILSKQRKLNGFTLAIGPSSAIFLKKSSHNTDNAPYLSQHRLSSVFPEFGLGYYWHKPDIHMNIAYRSINSNLTAYSHTQEINRKALSLEAYKFIGDYHGFAPFIGTVISREWLSVNESSSKNISESQREREIRFGLTFGWDIRPDRLQIWYLRTNLRWFPRLNVQMNSGDMVSMDQLEFNFIQLVLFPEKLFNKNSS